MIIIRDKNGITITETADNPNRIRIGIFNTCIFVNDTERRVMPNVKPHDDITIGDCRSLLDQLLQLERLHSN